MPDAPCAGQWQLFDSTDPYDHREAAAICADCPLIAACRDHLAASRKAARAHHIEYGPTGTWAGQLVGGDARNPYRLAAEEHMFTDDELRKAHRRYAAGMRDDRTCMGERVYQRHSSRRKRDRRAVA